MSRFFAKNISQVPIEIAHGGSGSRKLLLSQWDGVSQNIEAMTKGFLPAGSIFDWHEHHDIDEICLVIRWNGKVEFEDGSIYLYQQNDLMYFPANMKHKISNTDTIENEFYFIRINLK